jgi:hypothetical protein
MSEHSRNPAVNIDWKGKFNSSLLSEITASKTLFFIYINQSILFLDRQRISFGFYL